MSKIRSLFLVVLTIAVLTGMCGCNKEPADSNTTTVPQAEILENVSELFNEAVRKFEELQSYTMTGSVSSSSLMGDVATIVTTSIDCTYEKTADDYKMLMVSNQRIDGVDNEHTTYYEDGRYYLSTMGLKYIVESNDLGDFDAMAYLNQIEDTALSGVELQSNPNEGGWQIRFETPYGIYASNGLDAWLGGMTADEVVQQPVTVRAVIDAEGYLQTLYLSVENETSFGDQAIMQSVIASFVFTDCNKTTVEAPGDLDTYQDNTVDTGILDQNAEGPLPEDVTNGAE